MTKLSLVRYPFEEPPYYKHMGEVILKNGFTYLDGEQHIWDQMDKAAEKQDWEMYQNLMHDLASLEDNYL